jgi:UDP:flavonoid glycosyltransferase YjiC (YdhE family)
MNEPPVTPRRKARIVLTTFGSLGDLHPYIAIALGLKERGHRPVIATSAAYRGKVESLGIDFHAVRPDHPDLLAHPELIAYYMDLRKGPERVIRGAVMPALRDSCEDTLAAADGADLLVSHPLTLTTRLVAEKKGLPWASSVLSPVSFFSVHDPPVLAPAPFLSKLRFLGPALYRPLFGFLKWTIRSWFEPWHRLRAEMGLPPTSQNPLFEGGCSEALHLALCSKLLAPPQPDWPPRTVVTGFAFYDRDGEAGLPAGLAEFLDAGPPPIVFTLGSSAVMDAGPFYEHSAAAARRLGRRAVLLVGKDPRNRLASLPEGVAAFEYAPFSELFPRCAAIVHQGGIGTTGQALRSGRPMLVMPYAHDQPDNAERVVRLGVARTIPRQRYTAERAARELQRLLDTPSYSERAREVGRLVREEDGVRAACDALEAVIGS